MEHQADSDARSCSPVCERLLNDCMVCDVLFLTATNALVCINSHPQEERRGLGAQCDQTHDQTHFLACTPHTLKKSFGLSLKLIKNIKMAKIRITESKFENASCDFQWRSTHTPCSESPPPLVPQRHARPNKSHAAELPTSYSLTFLAYRWRLEPSVGHVSSPGSKLCSSADCSHTQKL